MCEARGGAAQCGAIERAHGGARRARAGARGGWLHAAVCAEPPGARHGWRAAASAAGGGAGQRAQCHRTQPLAATRRREDPALPHRPVHGRPAAVGSRAAACRRHGLHVRGAGHRVRRVLRAGAGRDHRAAGHPGRRGRRHLHGGGGLRAGAVHLHHRRVRVVRRRGDRDDRGLGRV